MTLRRTDNTSDSSHGVTGLDLIYRARCAGLLSGGIGLRASPQLVSVLTETAHQDGGWAGL